MQLRTAFIAKIVSGQIPVTIFLINGIKLVGTIDEYDADALILRRNGAVQLVLFHVVSTIVPDRMPEIKFT